MRTKVLLIAVALGMTGVPEALGAPAAESQPAYTVVDLGLYKGNPTLAHGINDGGRVVGQSGIAPNALPMVWTEGNGWVPLNPLPGDDRGGAFAINNQREIGGWSGHGDRSVGVVWDGTKMFQSPLVPGTDNAWAFAINDIREIVGVADASDGSHHAFFWCRNAGMIPIGNLPGMTESWATGINIYRRAVGWSGTVSYTL
jgi:probable HAF family extracellular repeat protein